MGRTRTNKELRTKGIEPGAASISIELRNGQIVVRHGSTRERLKTINNCKAGSWLEIWDAIEAIQSVEED